MILVTDLNNTMPKFQSSIIMMPGSDRQTDRTTSLNKQWQNIASWGP